MTQKYKPASRHEKVCPLLLDPYAQDSNAANGEQKKRYFRLKSKTDWCGKLRSAGARRGL